MSTTPIAQGPVDVNVGQLRVWLEQQGFCFGNNQVRGQMNDCDWYAWRRSTLSARDCDCNGPKMQIVLTPHSYELDGKRWESVAADVTGECAGVWYKLQAYSMTPTELVARLDEVEGALIRAWNSLMPNAELTGRGKES
ncbi:MAG: hypothetical protein M0R47_15750 [Methylobacter sp.]|uniref:hypothetical protein n=1 Tax=Methylobacter sp. TaxID=2051955 RepID=UPI0025ED72DA|nr:hypothetical protein [Methylobacter sp.]MCK9621974.1 hypothetical protein [Methylobacter sp.]